MNNRILKLRLKRVDPVKYALIAAISTIVIMLIVFVPFMLLFSVIGGAASESFGVAGAVLGGGLFMMIVAPLLYGVIVFIVTLIVTAILNFILSKTGGLDLDFEKVGFDLEVSNTTSQSRIEQ